MSDDDSDDNDFDTGEIRLPLVAFALWLGQWSEEDAVAQVEQFLEETTS